jgi:DNA polymerase-1
MKEMLEASKTITKKNNYKHILNPEHLDIALNVLKRQEFFSFDLETTSLVPHQAKILSFNFSWEEKTGIAFPYYYINNGNLEYFWEEEQRNKIIETLKEIFSSDVKITTQNGKYDSLVLKHNFGFGIKIAFDTMLASFLLDSNQNFNLDSITAREIPEEAGVKSEFWNSINADEEQRKEDWYLKISLEDLLDYGIHDADVTYRLTKILARRLNNVE